MNLIKKFLPPIAVILGAVGICYRFFGYILNDPGSYVFGSSPDGIKNYFSVFYQVLHGDGARFEGQLHPHGDLHVFADGQPVLTWILKLFYDSSTPIETLLGTMNSIMILGWVVSAFFVFLLLRKCNVGSWASVGFALIIAFLCPQMDRLAGHYALAYPFFVPAIWYFMLQMMLGSRRVIWTILYCLTVVVFSLNQPYYLIIATAFSGSMLGWYVFRNLVFLKKKLKDLPWLLTSVVVPAVILMVYLSSIDTVTDRPTAPFGLGSYDASFSGTFVPVNGPVSFLVRSYLFRLFDDPAWEARAFVGIPATFFLIFLCWRLVSGLLTSRSRTIRIRRFPKAIALSLLPAFFVLAFASGNLHKLGLFLLYDVMPQLKQFRSLGRLAWVFYFIFTVSAATYFYMIYRSLRIRLRPSKLHATTVFILICGVWTVDAISNIKSAKNLIGISPKPEWRLSNDQQEEIRSAGIDTSNYQAILPLPFALVGSEKLMKMGDQWSYSHAVDLSLKTGLPMFGGHMSRTSWSTTEKQSQFVAHPIRPKPILSELDSSKDILVLWSYAGLTPGEEFVRNNSSAVWKNDHYQLSSISIQHLQEVHSLYRNGILTALDFEVAPDSFFKRSQQVEFGQQFFEQTIADSATQQYEISYWTKIELNEVGTVKADGIISHEDGTTTEFKIAVDGSADVHDSWIRASETVSLKSGKNVILLNCGSFGGEITPVAIRAVGLNEIDLDTGSWNNYPLIK